MKREIERRFLVRGDAWRRQILDRELLRQGYLADDDKKVIRVRLFETKGVLSIKQSAGGLARNEFEYDIPLKEARHLLEEMRLGFVVEKLRHRLRHGGKIWEVDEFLGDNAGLVVAEIELEKEQEPFERPPWLGKEISGERRFSNAALARHPFARWPDRETVLG